VTDAGAHDKLVTIIDGCKLIVAVAFLVGSAAPVATTVIVWGVVTFDGGAYSPDAEIAPIFGFKDQVTAVFDEFVTVAVNCCCCG